MRDTHPLPEVDILIVADYAPVQSVMCHVLKAAAYSVAAVENGLAAVAAVQERRYRAIICDLGLPLVDGMRFYECMATKESPAAETQVVRRPVQHDVVAYIQSSRPRAGWPRELRVAGRRIRSSQPLPADHDRRPEPPQYDC